jgi:hypothetical protein
MGIKISVTYEEWSQEAIEAGETDERGFEFEDVDYGFRELVDYIDREGFTQSNCYPGTPDWLSTEGELHTDGSHTIKAIHPGKDARSQRYWAKACMAAGLVK